MPKITLDERIIAEIDETSSATHYLVLLSNGQVLSLPKQAGVTVETENNGPKSV